MSKSIRKICTVTIVITLVLASCASPAKSNITSFPPTTASNREPSFTLDTITANESENERESESFASRIDALDAEFNATMPEPDGSTASMIACAEAYLELWQNEVDSLLTANPSLADDFAAFEAELQAELDALAEQYQSDGSALYGSAVSYELTWHRAVALRDWLTEYYS